MKKLKERWEIHKNWQLLFPVIGLIALIYSAYKLSSSFIAPTYNTYIYILTAILFFALLKLVLTIFNRLEKKWQVTYRWELITIFLVFAFTGSSSVFVSRPIIKLAGITKDNLPLALYWILYIFIGFVFYQVTLVLMGWLFGQFKFFWNFEKKMLRRLGFKRFIN
ncbi:DUF6787 family protein [Snuella sedimenti]|uniref:DUF6787 domain-containing protein n=1 Tax=Snuella sedimenti TaxID=2798802 RepID=A0A8J7ITD8_9FLAO|nr:DUF6787 family protein [Snuella sedimenti]MBJ6367625.1 hypothetical protein [Snuella sedimenti]